MLSTDYVYINQQLLLIRKGATRDRLLGYLHALSCHCHIADDVSKRVQFIALNACQHASASLADLELQGWIEPPDPFLGGAL